MTSRAAERCLTPDTCACAQGWGNLVNTMILVILMAAFGQYGPTYNNTSLDIIWRLSYGARSRAGARSCVPPASRAVIAEHTTLLPLHPAALGLIPLIFMVYWRVFRLKESQVWIKKRQSVKDLGSSTAYDWRKNNLLLKYYWHRVAGCSLSWFVWDFAFYGEVGRGAMPGLVRTVATAPCPRAAAPLCVPRQQAVPVHLHPSDRARGIDHHHPGVDPAQLHGRAGWLLLCCFHDRQALDGAPLHAGHGEGWWAWAGCAAACARYKLMHASAPPLLRALLGWLCCS